MREKLIELLQNIDYVFDNGKHSMRDAIEFTADYLLQKGVVVLLCKLDEMGVSMGYLQDWYQNSIDNTISPVWTDEHLKELCNDFIIIPK